MIWGDFLDNYCDGKLIIIGGAEDKEGRKEILKNVSLELKNKSKALTIATLATEYPKEAWDKYKKVFLN